MKNTVNNDLTIQQARDIMRPLLNKGTKCLCCGLRTQLYTRSLTSSMVYGLILLYKESQGWIEQGKPDPFVHLETLFKESAIPSSIRADVVKAKFWGFIQARGEKKDDGNPNDGYYALTQKGTQFILGKILVQKSVKIYNNTFYGFDGPEIDVWGAIKNKFSYKDLMGGKI